MLQFIPPTLTRQQRKGGMLGTRSACHSDLHHSQTKRKNNNRVRQITRHRFIDWSEPFMPLLPPLFQASRAARALEEAVKFQTPEDPVDEVPTVTETLIQSDDEVSHHSHENASDKQHMEVPVPKRSSLEPTSSANSFSTHSSEPHALDMSMSTQGYSATADTPTTEEPESCWQEQTEGVSCLLQQICAYVACAERNASAAANSSLPFVLFINVDLEKLQGQTPQPWCSSSVPVQLNCQTVEALTTYHYAWQCESFAVHKLDEKSLTDLAREHEEESRDEVDENSAVPSPDTVSTDDTPGPSDEEKDSARSHRHAAQMQEEKRSRSASPRMHTEHPEYTETAEHYIASPATIPVPSKKMYSVGLLKSMNRLDFPAPAFLKNPLLAEIYVPHPRDYYGRWGVGYRDTATLSLEGGICLAVGVL